MKCSLFALLACTLLSHSIAGQPCKTPPSGPRPVVVISDLHFGAGMAPDVAAFEDFRWPRALNVFLDQLNPTYGPNVDLVIAGDLFEFWQHPTVGCADGKANFGCSVQGMTEVTKAAIIAHATELQSIGRFATHDGNQVYVIPGNHDAALMLDDVWLLVAKSIGDIAGVTRVTSGRWFSSDCRVAVEHGHQIDHDLNRFPNWPRVSETKDGLEYIWKPWGEAFVADQFNHIEKNYPLIDNVLPLTSGLKMYLDEHTIASDARDVASFIGFNIFRTSLRQKIALNVYSDASPVNKWDVPTARALGYRLIASAMPDDDPDRDKLLASTDDIWRDTRTVFDKQLADREAMPDDEVATLCDLAAAYTEKHTLESATSKAERLQCSQALLVKIGTSFIPERRVLTSYVSDIQKAQPKVRYFIYGHTHQWVWPFPVQLTSGISATVLNDGAFQRLVSLDTLRAAYARRHKNETTEKSSALTMNLDELPPCYTAAVIKYERGLPIPEIKLWVFGESYRSGILYDATAPPNVCTLK